ncbi:hypothetical protein ACLIBG_03620 [Virgibacillus sp. W0181]|uniref:hypothetical protein n=1 Tax=Virgibacillus sp. W0181 TaxID=3391581 RepID=UPI003F46A0AF
MTVEINFIEKKESKYVAPVLFAIAFIFLLLLIAALIFYQRYELSTTMESDKAELAGLETELLSLQKETADEQLLKRIEKEMEKMQEETAPVFSMYEETVLPLAGGKLSVYEMTEPEKIVIVGAFTSLTEVADYTEMLSEKSYITDTELTEITNGNDGFEAMLTLKIDSALAVEELNEHAQTLE